MMSRKGLWVLWATMVVGAIVAGCARAPIVQPTEEELAAAKRFKKTVAIVGLTDAASPIQGIQAVAQAKLENLLVGHFNLVERDRIAQVMAERNLGTPDTVERMTELGKLLGADYVLFGNAAASLDPPRTRQEASKDQKGRFYGRIWTETCGTSEFSLRIVKVSDGTVVYADKRRAQSCQSSGEQAYGDESQFKRASRAQTTAGLLGQIASHFGRLEERYSGVVAGAMDQAVAGFRAELRNRFPQGGEILRVLSTTEVMVNLGSAYGVRPGAQLIVWSEYEGITDPKTGIVTVPKVKKATLKVKQITSGLTCVASASAGTIAQLRVGDKVETYN